MANFKKTSVGPGARAELHELLGLTGVLAGRGRAVIDGETVELSAGDWVRVSPAAKRQFSAAADSGIRFICVQARENSLEGYTMDDAVVEEPG